MAGLQGVPVCIDGRMLGDGTGVSTYARAVLAALPEAGILPWVLAATLPALGRKAKWLAAASPRPRLLDRAGIFEGHPTLRSPDLFRIAHVHFGLYRRALRLIPPVADGVMHWTYPLPIHVEGWTNIYTVHDLIPLTNPELSPIDPRRHARVLQTLDQSADAFITVSESSRRALIARLGCAPARVIDCGSAVIADGPEPPASPTRDYLLVCGSIEPRKNIAMVAAAHAASGTDLPLTIAGPDGWRADAVRRAVGDRVGVRWLPFQTRAEMIRLIAGARAVLMPSLAEGFGLPVAEAMTLGTPVLTSNHGALAEIAGNAALLVDPGDLSALARAIGRIAIDDELVQRLVARGRERATEWTSQQFAARLASAYGTTRAIRRASGRGD